MGILWRQENYKKLTDVPFIFCSFRNNQWTSLGYTWIISVICFGSKILRENSIKWKKKKETSFQVIVFQWQKQMIVAHRSWIALAFDPSHLLGSKYLICYMYLNVDFGDARDKFAWAQTDLRGQVFFILLFHFLIFLKYITLSNIFRRCHVLSQTTKIINV